MPSYTYPQILEYLNKSYSVSKKPESTFFALKIAKMWISQEINPLLMWLLRELMIPYTYPKILEYLNKPYSVSKKSESSFFD